MTIEKEPLIRCGGSVGKVHKVLAHRRERYELNAALREEVRFDIVAETELSWTQRDAKLASETALAWAGRRRELKDNVLPADTLQDELNAYHTELEHSLIPVHSGLSYEREAERQSRRDVRFVDMGYLPIKLKKQKDGSYRIIESNSPLQKRRDKHTHHDKAAGREFHRTMVSWVNKGKQPQDTSYRSAIPALNAVKPGRFIMLKLDGMWHPYTRADVGWVTSAGESVSNYDLAHFLMYSE